MERGIITIPLPPLSCKRTRLRAETHGGNFTLFGARRLEHTLFKATGTLVSCSDPLVSPCRHQHRLMLSEPTMRAPMTSTYSPKGRDVGTIPPGFPQCRFHQTVDVPSTPGLCAPFAFPQCQCRYPRPSADIHQLDPWFLLECHCHTAKLQVTYLQRHIMREGTVSKSGTP